MKYNVKLNVILLFGEVVAFAPEATAFTQAQDLRLIDEKWNLLDGVDILVCTVSSAEFIDEHNPKILCDYLTNKLEKQKLKKYKKRYLNMLFENYTLSFAN